MFTNSSLLYIFLVMHDRYMLGITGNFFLNSQQFLHLCKVIRSGLHGNRARAKKTLKFTCENKTKTHSAQNWWSEEEEREVQRIITKDE